MAKYKNKNALLWKTKRLIKNYFLLDLLSTILFTIELFYKKNNNILLYFFSKGEGFSDNSKYLFEYLENNSDYNQVLFTLEKELYKELNNVYPGKVVFGLSPKGIKTFFRVKHIIISNGIDRISFYPYLLSTKTKNIIQLWHGSLFKRLGFQVKDWDTIKSRKEYQKFTKFVVCSTMEKFMAASCFNLSIDQIWLTNYPRNDYVLNPTLDLSKEHPYLNKKTILYAPTWREEGHKVEFFPFKDVDINEIQKFLENNDAYLLIRGHASEMERIADLYDLDLNKTNRIISAHQAIFPRTEQLLPHVDILITDYSGIAIDYLLLNRPIIYLPYDLETYCSYRGLMYDFDEFVAGPKVFDQKDFLAKLKLYIYSPETDTNLRLSKQKQFHDNIDGKARARLKDNIDILVKQ